MEKNLANSQILYQETAASPIKAGKIDKIVKQNSRHGGSQSQVYLVICPLMDCIALDEPDLKLIERYTRVGGKFYLDCLSTTFTVIKPEQVVGHFFSFSYPSNGGRTYENLVTFSVSKQCCRILAEL